MATLYHVPTSRSLRVLWTLEEIGATVEVKSLGVRPRLQEPEYLAINPAGTLPALIDGDRAIYESLAICEYLAARHGSDLIVAPDEPERPEFVQWLLYGEATLQAPLSATARVRRIRNTTPEMQAGIDAVLSDARHSLSMRVKLLEQRLEGTRSITWESPTSPRCSVPAPRPIVSACLRGQRSSAPRPFPSLGWAVNSLAAFTLA
jgi:glutathione S-transferase